jgi:hypothetical protein
MSGIRFTLGFFNVCKAGTKSKKQTHRVSLEGRRAAARAHAKKMLLLSSRALPTYLKLARVGDDALLERAVAAVDVGALDLLHDVKALYDLAKHDVAAVEPRRLFWLVVGGWGDWWVCLRVCWLMGQGCGADFDRQRSSGRPTASTAQHDAFTRQQAERNHPTSTVQMKNCEPLVLGPALAIDRMPGPVWRYLKFSSVRLVLDVGFSAALRFLVSCGVASCAKCANNARFDPPTHPHPNQRAPLLKRTLKLHAVDRLAAGAVAGRKVAALDHKVLDHAVERGALEAKAGLACVDLDLGFGVLMVEGFGHAVALLSASAMSQTNSPLLRLLLLLHTTTRK